MWHIGYPDLTVDYMDYPDVIICHISYPDLMANLSLSIPVPIMLVL